MYFHRSGSKVHQHLSGVERREAAVGNDCQLMEFRLGKGSVIPAHHHVNEQIGIVVSGRLVMRIGNEQAILESGDGYSIPPDTEHSVEVLEDSLVLDVFAPPRDDYRDH
jgi:quercetin dioxygenase-like cupin family protein